MFRSNNQETALFADFKLLDILVLYFNTGIVYWHLLFAPFKIERVGDGTFWIVHLLVLTFFVYPILLLELGTGLLNQCGLLNTWGKMVPLLKGTDTST